MADAIDDEGTAEAVEAALGMLDLDTKARLLAGQDMWTLPAVPEIGLSSLVMSDGPIGVRGVRWTADDPSIALPSPDRARRDLGPGAGPPRGPAARAGGPPQGRPRAARARPSTCTARRWAAGTSRRTARTRT